MKAKSKQNEIQIILSNNEALVLFEWLVRFNENNENKFQDQSEERVLWDLEAELEKCSLISLSEDYISRLVAARDTLKDKP